MLFLKYGFCNGLSIISESAVLYSRSNTAHTDNNHTSIALAFADRNPQQNKQSMRIYYN